MSEPIPSISEAALEPSNAPDGVGTFSTLRLQFGTKAVESRSQVDYSFTTLGSLSVARKQAAEGLETLMKIILTFLVGKGDKTRSPCICSHVLLLPEVKEFTAL